MSESAKQAKPKAAAKDEPKRYDKVAFVPRHVDGRPALNEGFKVVVQEGATDEEKAAAWNAGGELPPEDVLEYVPRPFV